MGKYDSPLRPEDFAPVEYSDRPGLDDPLWEHVLRSRLMPYIPSVLKWWDNINDSITTIFTGITPIEGAPPGLMAKFTKSPKKSPIKNVQAFPFVPTAFLQINGIQGGVNKMVERICTKGFVIEGLEIVCKSHLPATYLQGQIIAFIPQAIMDNIITMGQWIYMTREEMVTVAEAMVPETLRTKVLLRL
jgi:hypothetical protein